MHPRILAERSARAEARIVDAATTIAAELGLTGLTLSLAKDPAVRSLQEREAVATLLEEIAGAIAHPAEAPVSEEEPAEQPEEEPTEELPDPVLEYVYVPSDEPAAEIAAAVVKAHGSGAGKR
jgi:ATP phosphoribosyltransferase regulatory subunit HisZ